MDPRGEMGADLNVYVVIVVDKDHDQHVGGVLTTKEEAEKQGYFIMEYDDSITEFFVLEEELLDEAE